MCLYRCCSNHWSKISLAGRKILSWLSHIETFLYCYLQSFLIPYLQKSVLFLCWSNQSYKWPSTTRKISLQQMTWQLQIFMNNFIFIIIAFHENSSEYQATANSKQQNRDKKKDLHHFYLRKPVFSVTAVLPIQLQEHHRWQKIKCNHLNWFFTFSHNCLTLHLLLFLYTLVVLLVVILFFNFY